MDTSTQHETNSNLRRWYRLGGRYHHVNQIPRPTKTLDLFSASGHFNSCSDECFQLQKLTVRGTSNAQHRFLGFLEEFSKEIDPRPLSIRGQSQCALTIENHRR